MTKRKLCLGAVGVLATGLCGGLISVPVLAEGPVDINIVEKVEDGSGGYKDWEDITGAMPGMSYSAIPRVLNKGSMAVEVRMCLSESAVNAGGEKIVLPANTFGLNINENWGLESGVSGDAAAGTCYKYQTKLGAGVETEPLFTEVTLSPMLANEYQGATFSLHLEAYAASDEPVGPIPDPAGGSDTDASPKSPDTGADTWVENFVINSGLMFLTAGVLAFLIVWVRKRIRK